MDKLWGLSSNEHATADHPVGVEPKEEVIGSNSNADSPSAFFSSSSWVEVTQYLASSDGDLDAAQADLTTTPTIAGEMDTPSLIDSPAFTDVDSILDFPAGGFFLRKELPASVVRTYKPGLLKQGSSTLAAAAQDDDDAVDLADHIAQKRRANTIAARKSRQRKAQFVEGLKTEIEGLQAEVSKADALMKENESLKQTIWDLEARLAGTSSDTRRIVSTVRAKEPLHPKTDSPEEKESDQGETEGIEGQNPARPRVEQQAMNDTPNQPCVDEHATPKQISSPSKHVALLMSSESGDGSSTNAHDSPSNLAYMHSVSSEAGASAAGETVRAGSGQRALGRWAQPRIPPGEIVWPSAPASGVEFKPPMNIQRPGRSRATPVCNECKRLKLLCDQKQPCNNCSQRGSTSRCTYNQPPAFVVPGRRFEMTVQQLSNLKKEQQIEKNVYRASISGTQQLKVVALRSAANSRGKSRPGPNRVQLFDHPNVAAFVGWMFEGDPCIVTPWSTGDLSTYLQQNPKARRRQLLAQVSAGLEYLHTAGIMHTALTPHNVAISAIDGGAVLTNIGVLSTIEYSLKGEIVAGEMNDIRYFSPEYVRDGIFTFKGDIYSFACLFLEVVSNEPPFPKLNEPHITLAIAKGARPSHPEATAEFIDVPWEVVSHCWDQNPDERPHIFKLKQQLAGWYQVVAGERPQLKVNKTPRAHET